MKSEAKANHSNIQVHWTKPIYIITMYLWEFDHLRGLNNLKWFYWYGNTTTALGEDRGKLNNFCATRRDFRNILGVGFCLVRGSMITIFSNTFAFLSRNVTTKMNSFLRKVFAKHKILTNLSCTSKDLK